MNKLTKREIIKNIAIIFLVIMLILTFFSKTIMNRTLPEVSTQNVTSGTITTQVRGTGTVVSDDPYNVIIDETRKVAGVLKHEGDHVEIGDVIYKLDGESSDELTDAKNTYEEEKRKYDLLVIDKVKDGLTQSEVSSIEAGVTSTTGTIIQKLQQMDNAIVAAEKERDTASDNLETVTKERDRYVEHTVDISNEEKAVANAQTALDASKALLAQHDENIAIVKEYNQMVDDRNYYYGLIQGKKSPSAPAEDPGEIDQNYDYYAEKINELTISINEKEREKNEAANKIPAQQDYDNQVADVKAKEAALANAEKNLENKKNSSDPNVKALKDKVDAATDLLAEKEAKLSALTNERDDYYNKEIVKIDIETEYQKLIKMQNDIKDLEAKAIGGTVTAPVAGTISSVSYTAGEKIESGSVAAVIQIEGKGYSLSFTVSDKQAKSVKVGDEVTIVDSWYYSDIVANLVAIQPDKNSQRDEKKLVFSISGDSVHDGQNLTLSVGQRSSNYDLIVPLNALREDNKGNFVLILDTKSTPFGSRYVAKRVDVEILEKDDKNAAVKGELSGWEYVITNSSKPLENKDQVKLAE